MSNDTFRDNFIKVLHSVKNGQTATSARNSVQNLMSMPISTRNKTKIMREVQQTGTYAREIPKLVPLMQPPQGGRRKHTIRKTRRNRKRKTLRK